MPVCFGWLRTSFFGSLYTVKYILPEYPQNRPDLFSRLTALEVHRLDNMTVKTTVPFPKHLCSQECIGQLKICCRNLPVVFLKSFTIESMLQFICPRWRFQLCKSQPGVLQCEALTLCASQRDARNLLRSPLSLWSRAIVSAPASIAWLFHSYCSDSATIKWWYLRQNMNSKICNVWRWSENGQKVSSNANGYILMSVFPASYFQLGDTGFYSCIASTPSGEASWKAHLEVHGKLSANNRMEYINDTWLLCFIPLLNKWQRCLFVFNKVQVANSFLFPTSICSPLRVWSPSAAKQTHRSKLDPKCPLQTRGDGRHAHLRHPLLETQHRRGHAHLLHNRGLQVRRTRRRRRSGNVARPPR